MNKVGRWKMYKAKKMDQTGKMRKVGKMGHCSLSKYSTVSRHGVLILQKKVVIFRTNRRVSPITMAISMKMLIRAVSVGKSIGVYPII